MTKKSYLTSGNTSGTVTVTELIAGEKAIVRLIETWFHPQGGGQKPDRGSIGKAQVLHVAHNAGYVDHFVDSLDGLVVGESYPFSVDLPWRRINSVYHTAGHLIAGVVEELRPGFTAVSGHQWPGEARVEFTFNTDGAIGELETTLPKALSESLIKSSEVFTVGDPFSSREIRIGSFKSIPCGGTHARSLAEISEIRILSIKKKSDRIRISYEAIPS